MLHLRRYLKILGESRKIIEDYGAFPDVEASGYRSALLIYRTAFEQLAASGIPLSEEDDALRLETDGDTFILRKKGHNGSPGMTGSRPCGELLLKDASILPEEPPFADTEKAGAGKGEKTEGSFTVPSSDPPEREEMAAEEEEGRGVETEAEGEEDEHLPDDYGMDVTTAKTPEHPAESVTPDEGSVDRNGKTPEEPAAASPAADAPEAEDDEKPEKNSIAAQEGAPVPAGYNTEVLEGVETEYGQKETLEMPDHMFKDDFTFSYTDISITGANGKKAEAQAIIAPLNISEEYPRIICCTIQGEKSETAVSNDNRMKIRVGGFTVKVEGRMENGKFKSSCVLPAHYLLEGTRIEAKTRDFGTKGHILLEEKEEDLQIHIIPATFRNNASGNADYIYFISRGGQETAGDTSVVKAAVFSFSGKEYEIRCRWNADGILYSMAAEKGDGIGTGGDV